MIKINLRARKNETRKWVYTLTLFAIALLVGTLSGAHETIIEGETAKAGEFPAVVILKMSEHAAGVGAEGWEGSCTGFLVAPKLILTAAHCLQGHSSVDAVANGVNGTSGKDARSFKSAEVGSHPDFVVPTADRTDAEKRAAAACDIGYVVLKEAVPETEIAPIGVYVTTDSPSMMKLDGLEATLVGYGATEWRSDGNYEHAKTGTKIVGKKSITGVNLGFVVLDGEKGGALPGDSGGPILATVDGATKVVALNHAMSNAKKTVVKTDKHGNPKLDKKGRPKTEETTVYGATIGTMLTKRNLCWVVATSGIEIPGVDCSKPKATTPSATPGTAK